MKTKVIYSIVVLCLAFVGISCDDKNDNQPDITGAWNYESPHFIFDYAQDSVSIVMNQGKKMSIAVDDLKKIFLGMATEKMKDYFVGVEFNPGNKLKIKMLMQGGVQGTLGADYTVKENMIEVSLDTADLKQLTGGVAPKIPAISFKYTVTADKMQMYFDQVYVQTVISMMQAQLLDMIIPMLGIDTSHMPSAALEEMKKQMKAQISGILDNIVRLEIGFNLTRENLLK